MSRNRKFSRSLRRMILAGLFAGAGFAPAVASAHVSPLGGPTAPQKAATVAASTSFVQVGGDLVQRSQVAMYKHEVLGTAQSVTPAASTVSKAGNSSGFNWLAAVIAVAAVAAACFLAAGAYVIRRRTRLTPA